MQSLELFLRNQQTASFFHRDVHRLEQKYFDGQVDTKMKPISLKSVEFTYQQVFGCSLKYSLIPYLQLSQAIIWSFSESTIVKRSNNFYLLPPHHLLLLQFRRHPLLPLTLHLKQHDATF